MQHGTRNPILIGRSLRQSMMTYLITNFVLTTKTAGVVRGKKKGMEEEAKQETNREGSDIKNNFQ